MADSQGGHFSCLELQDTLGGLQGSRFVENEQAPWGCLFQKDLLTGRPFLLSGAAGILVEAYREAEL